MKCETFQANVIELLAGEEREMPRELREHSAACPACREFSTGKADLLAAIDASMREFVNQPVPSSLYRVAAPLPEPTSGGRLSDGMPLWLAGLAVVSALLLIGFLGLRNSSSPVLRSSPQEVVSAAKPPSLLAHTRITEHTAPSIHAKGTKSSKLLLPKSEGPSSEIIVLPEERQAFAQFVTAVSQDREIALALTHPAPPEVVSPIEIALLRIEDIEVKPLEAEQKE